MQSGTAPSIESRSNSLKLQAQIQDMISQAQTFQIGAAQYLAPIAANQANFANFQNTSIPPMLRAVESLKQPEGKATASTVNNTVNVGDIVINDAQGLDAATVSKMVGQEFTRQLGLTNSNLVQRQK